MSNFFKQLDKFGGDGRGIARRLQNYSVAADDGSRRHAGHDGAGEIPRRNYCAYSERNVGERIVLAGHLHGRLGFGETQGFASIKFQEVDGLGNIGVGFAPVLADFKNEPGHVIHFALAHAGRRRGTAGWRALPSEVFFQRVECLQRGGHGRFHMLFAGLLMDADYLRWLRRIQRLDLVGSLDALAADDEVILAAKLAADALDGSAHLAGVVFLAEVEEGLVGERALMELR